MIRGIRTNLRAVERSDARFVADLLNQPSVQAGWGTGDVPISIHRVERDVEHWLETERTTDRPVALIIETLDLGPIGLLIVDLPDRFNQRLATLSIAIDSERQNQGYGRDALSSVIDALFDEWGIHRIEMICEAGNDRAAHVYASLGFTREATRREATFCGGRFHDQHLYGLLSTDPRPGTP